MSQTSQSIGLDRSTGTSFRQSVEQPANRVVAGPRPAEVNASYPAFFRSLFLGTRNRYLRRMRMQGHCGSLSLVGRSSLLVISASMKQDFTAVNEATLPSKSSGLCRPVPVLYIHLKRTTSRIIKKIDNYLRYTNSSIISKGR